MTEPRFAAPGGAFILTALHGRASLGQCANTLQWKCPTSWTGPEVVIYPLSSPGAMPDGQRQKSLNRSSPSSVWRTVRAGLPQGIGANARGAAQVSAA